MARGGLHGQTYITILPEEELDFIQPSQRKKGWNFWAGFAGRKKGPCLFWETEEWGSINSDTFMEHVIPLIYQFMRENPGCIFMQDNAPAHRSRATQSLLNYLGIRPIEWPPYSPDLNPIEHVWKWMKDWIALNYPGELTRDTLREAVYAAWDAVPEDFLESLVRSMPSRVRECYQRNGGITHY
jgi:transposase